MDVAEWCDSKSGGVAQPLSKLDEGSSSTTKENFLTTGLRLLQSTQMWMSALPSKHCDVLAVVAPSDKDNTQETVNWVVSLLQRDSRLRIDTRYNQHTNTYALYISASKDDLLKGADVMQMRKHLKEEYGGGVQEFIYRDADSFVGAYDKDFLTSQEKAMIAFSFLNCMRATMNEEFGTVKLREGEPILPVLRRTNVISKLLPLHSQWDLNQLKKTWVSNFVRPQPFNDIKDYFGEQIAMYFAWLSHYTKALTIPAAIGLFHWLFVSGRHQVAEDICIVSFAIVNILWATIYLESWKRRQAEVAYQWDTLGMENDLLLEPRPEFKGELRRSRVTGRIESYYPPWKQNVSRYLVSLPVTALCLLAMFCVMLTIFQVQHFCDKTFATSAYFSWVTVLPKVALAVVVSMADDSYTNLAAWLTEQENCRTDEAYENSLIIKTVVFQFINSFLALFYIAFYLNDMDRLRTQLAALLITRQVIGNVKEAVIPFFVEKAKLGKIAYKMAKKADKTSQLTDTQIAAGGHGQVLEECGDPKNDAQSDGLTTEEGDGSRDPLGAIEETGLRHRRRDQTTTSLKPISSKAQNSPQLTQADAESLLPRYPSPLADYLEMYIQFGLVLLFSPAFPLAAVCALVNNVFEIHVDSFKLCNSFQRPFGKRVENIGSWLAAMEVMGIIGVMVNCALIGYSGVIERFWPELSLAGKILLVVVLEHIVLALKFFIAVAIPDIPHWITLEMARVEFKRRTALRNIESEKVKGKASLDVDPETEQTHL